MIGIRQLLQRPLSV